MKRFYSELCTQNLLLIGCNFADWLSRLFIRLSNNQRLAENRSNREFLIEESSASGNLTLFRERFSPDTWALPGRAREFVAELARRRQAKYPRSAPRPEVPSPRPRSGEAFFISYSRTDLAAASRFYADLQDIGIEVDGAPPDKGLW